MESKQKLDHREIAKSLGLYYLDKGSGQGLPLLLPNFTFIRNKIQDLIRKK